MIPEFRYLHLSVKCYYIIMQELYRIIGLRIREQRTSLKINQQELADSSNISRATLSSIETGQNRIPVDVLYKLAENLGVSVYELIPSDPNSQMDEASYNRITNHHSLNVQLDSLIEKAKEENNEE